MIYISHRGLVNGADKDLENNPDQITHLNQKNINVEIDVRFYKNKFYLGHDEPIYEITKSFLQNDKLWCHAKNIDALHEMLKEGIHCFWHQEDDVTLTSKGYLWTYPGKQLTEKSICVLPEFEDKKSKVILPKNVAGICSDFIVRFI